MARCSCQSDRREEKERGGEMKEMAHMRGSENGAVPVTHQEILAVLETVAACLGTKTLLALLELF